MRFFITITGECEDIPRLYNRAAELADLVDNAVGIKMTSMEVEEDEPPVTWTGTNPYTNVFYKGTEQQQPTITGVDNT